VIAPADLAALAKLRISLLSTFSAAAAFAVAARSLRPPLAATLAGTFLLAAGAAAINAVLDRARDARMERTRDRPLPAGRIGPLPATALALAAGAAGAALLWRGAGPTPALLGVAALAWYDAVYTPLKRATAFAVVPGALVGALPPAIGWTAAGGSLADGGLHALCAFVLAWQVPHAWLLALRHADDYARGGFPTPARRLSVAQLGRVARAWILAAAGTALLLPLFGVARSPLGAAALAVAAAALLPTALRLPRDAARAEALARPFAAVNLFAAAVLAIAAADALR
jgi:protoheme IX farnesyltransferase